MFGFHKFQAQKKEEGTLCRWGACCSCLCCPKEVQEKEDLKFRAILDKLDLVESNMVELKPDDVSHLRLTYVIRH